MADVKNQAVFILYSNGIENYGSRHSSRVSVTFLVATVSEPLPNSELYFLNLVLCLGKIAVHVVTFPYYRVFQFNVIKPILRIAACASQPEELNTVLRLITRWRTRKLSELQFISIVCAVLAAAVIGSFSWGTVQNAYWLASALWYGSLWLSILGILISAQQIAVLDLLGPPPSRSNQHLVRIYVRRYLPLMLSENRQQEFRTTLQSGQSDLVAWKPRLKMIFTWQCPIMCMSYSATLFLAGLTIFICTPLVRESMWSDGGKIAVVYLAIAGMAGVVFVFCSFWIYHYIDLEQDSDELVEPEPEQAVKRALSQSPRNPEDLEFRA